MGKQRKFIESHSKRVKRAEEYRKNSPEEISIFDREALVEFYLLENIVDLYKYRLEREENKQVNTSAGEKAKQSNIQKFSAIIKIFEYSVEIAWGQIDSGNYKAVWQAIHEHALMTAANSVKYLPQLKELGINLMKKLYKEEMMATEVSIDFDEKLNEIENRKENTYKVKGFNSFEEMDEIIREVERVIPNENNKKSKLNAKMD